MGEKSMKEWLVRIWFDLENNVYLNHNVLALNEKEAVRLAKVDFPGLLLYVAYPIEDGEILG